MSWHADALLPAYAAGRLSSAQEAAVEAHVMACDRCRMALAPYVDRDREEASWAGVVASLHAPRPSPVEFVLLRLRKRSDIARLVAVTPALSPSWLGGVAIVLACSLAAAHVAEVRGLLGFLLLAPLLPVAGVATSYGRGIDPLYELIVASPMETLRLLMLRSATVVCATSLLAVVAAAALPVRGWVAIAWLLPSLAMAVATLALVRWVPLIWAAGGLMASWIVLVVTTTGLLRPDPVLVALPFSAAGQLVYALVAAVAVAVLAYTRDRRAPPKGL